MSHLSPLQQKLLTQLEDIDRVCKKHNIPYALVCGTLLGAVRHQGFIPWDDDVDIIMTREAFIAFEASYQKEKDSAFVLDLEDTWVPRVKQTNDPNSPFSDIFILDNLPNNSFLAKVQILLLHLLQGMLKENTHYAAFSFSKKVFLRFTHFIGLPFSKKKKITWYHRLSQSSQKGKKVFMANGAYADLFIHWDSEIFTNLKLHVFETLHLPIPSDYAYVLTRFFGPDYMIPPPVSERVAKHTL